MTSRRLTGGADAATPSTDAATGGADSAPAEPTVVVFENAEGSFVWTCGWIDEFGDGEPGAFLDPMKPADAQTGDGTPASIRCFKFPRELNETPGGTLFQSGYNPDAPSSPVASIARGEPFVLEGLADDYYDIDVTPPLAKEPGDVVGPDDDWGSGNPPTPRVQVVHLQDYANNTAGDQVWFTSGIIGVRLPAEDGAHYGFVELELVPAQVGWPGRWTTLRWGYRAEPNQPLTIPP